MSGSRASQKNSKSPKPTSREGAAILVPLFPLTPVGKSVYYHRPDARVKATRRAGEDVQSTRPDYLKPLADPKSKVTGAIVPPRVILVFGWMNAPLRIVSKYAQPYSVLFPTSTVIIKLSDGQTYLQGSKSRALDYLTDLLRQEAEKVESWQEKLIMDQDVRELLGTYGEKKDELQQGHAETTTAGDAVPHGMVVHSFSDGGANNLAFLLSHITSVRTSSAGDARAESNPFAVLTPRAVIMDSSPSSGRVWSGATAFTIPLAHPSRNWLVRLVLRNAARWGLCVLMAVVLFVKRHILKSSTRHSLMRGNLNDAHRWDFTSVGIANSDEAVQASATSLSSGSEHNTIRSLPPRLYLYSKADDLVDYEAVEAHARDYALRRRRTSSSVETDSKKRWTKGDIDAEENDVLTIVEVEREKSTSSVSSSPPPSLWPRLRRWTTAPHCALARQDPKVYWSEVRDFLSIALLSSSPRR